MKPHVEATLREIEEQIVNLQALARGLRALPCEATAPPNGAIAPRRMAPSRLPRSNAPGSRKLVDVMREMIAELKGEFSVTQLREMIEKAHPEMAKRLAATSVNLIDMASRGELHRQGAGRDAKYFQVKLKMPHRVQQAYKAFRETVPMPATETA
jgi:hypothetical protein